MSKFITIENIKKYKVIIFILGFVIVFGSIFGVNYLSEKFFGCVIVGDHVLTDNVCSFYLDVLMIKLIEFFSDIWYGIKNLI